MEEDIANEQPTGINLQNKQTAHTAICQKKKTKKHQTNRKMGVRSK